MHLHPSMAINDSILNQQCWHENTVSSTVEVEQTYMNSGGAHSSKTKRGRELKLCMKQHHTKGYCPQK